MKYLPVILALLFLLPLVTSAVDVKLCWQPVVGSAYTVFQSFDLRTSFTALVTQPENSFLFTSDQPNSFFYVLAQKESLHLQWSASPDLDRVTGYAIYYACDSGLFNNRVDAGNNLDVVIEGLKPGKTYRFAAVAYDSDGVESDFSPVTCAGLTSQVTGLEISLK